MGLRFDKQSGLPQAMNVVEAGADPAQISVDATGRFLFTAYWWRARSASTPSPTTEACQRGHCRRFPRWSERTR